LKAEKLLIRNSLFGGGCVARNELLCQGKNLANIYNIIMMIRAKPAMLPITTFMDNLVVFIEFAPLSRADVGNKRLVLWTVRLAFPPYICYI